MENKIVVHMKDGTVHKGVTQDFNPSQEGFHLLPAEGGGVPMTIRLEDMKALFYVKDYVGNADYVTRKMFDEAKRSGRRMILTFADGEEIWGTINQEVEQEGAGFYFFPADEGDNNVKIFVIRSSLKEMRQVS